MEPKNIETLIFEAQRLPQILNRLISELNILSRRNKQLEQDLSDSVWNYTNLLCERQELLRQIEELSKTKLHNE